MDKIKVGLLVSSNQIPNWLAHTISQIQSSNYAEISALIIKKNTEKNKLTYRSILRSTPLILAQKLDRLVFQSKFDAFKMVGIKELIKEFNLFTIEVETIETQHTDTLSTESLEQISKLDLDILFRGGFKILKGDILTRGAKYGIWSFHHGDNRFYRGSPACFWEVYNKQPSTGFVLQKLTSILDGGKIIAKGNVPTIPYSLNLTRQSLYWDAQSILICYIEKLFKHGYKNLNAGDNEMEFPAIYDRPLYKTPNFTVGAIFLLKLILRWASVKVNKIFNSNKKRWFVGWMKTEEQFILRKCHYMFPPINSFWADPFIVNYQGNDLLFIEEYTSANGKGHITSFTYDKIQKKFSNPQKVLEEPFHLSYPSTLIDDQMLYIIPESKQANQIRLYKWDGVKLVFDCVLLDNIKAVDSNILFYNNKYWLFTSQQLSDWGNVFHHCIYYSHQLKGPYKPHLLNPISNSASYSRAGGELIRKENTLYRVSQNCSGDYGKSLTLHRIIELSETKYEEVPIEEIEPQWDKNITKIHTLNFNSNFTVVDLFGKLK